MKEPNREETIFAAALALPPGERATCLDQACGGDAELRRRVEVLLSAHAASEFLEAPAAPVAMPTLRISPPLNEQAGDRIGRYKLLQQIGEGGCGIVYMAEQDEPVRRRVALKVIKLGMDTKQVIARFEAERQALALMDHPNIAKVLDAGAAENGRPYFVMELVRGIKITEYCDHNKLPNRERLDLFMQVCRAIQHAHQKGIIHRDIKPSNILVTINDGVSVPKVIDFGIAKATQGRLTDKTLFTAFEQFIGTPAYMSPEQAVMTSLDIDTRSDIYSLGVLLYELLTGKTPFDSKELLEAGLDEMRRTIQEQEPERPSTKLSTMVEGELTITAKRHHTEPPKLISSVRGDLDWIVMKCLEKDRARRYETVNGLARDLQRHLDQEPVRACPPSNVYRFQKLVRRNKLAFGAGAVIAATLVLGVVVSTWQAISATRARAIALEAARQAQLARSAEAEQRRRATQARDEAQNQEIRARRNAYLANVALAYEALQKGHLGRARELQQKAADAAAVVEPAASREGQKAKDLRGWEWRYLWSQTRGDDLFILGRHEPMAQVALWMPDGVRAVSCGKDGLVKFWNVDERRLLNQLSFPDRPNGLALSPDGTRLVVGLEDGRISLWDATSLQTIWQVKLPHLIGHIAYSPDGKMIAVAGGDKISVVWARDGSLRHSVNDTNIVTWKVGLAFSPDSRSLAFGVPWRPEVRVLDLQEGTEQQLPMPEGRGVLTLAFSPDGRKLVSGDPSAILTIWDWPARRINRVLRSHRQQVICVAFSPDGTRMASAGADQSIKLWDTRTWAETCSLRGHDFEIWSVAFSPDGKRLISSAKDDTVRIWPTEPSTKRLEVLLPAGFGLSKAGTNSSLVFLNGLTGEFMLGGLFTGEIIQQGALDPCLLKGASAAKFMSNQIVIGFRDGHVELCDLPSQARIWSITNHTRAVTRIAGSARSGKIAVAYEDGRIDLLRRDTGDTGRRLQMDPLRSELMLELDREGKRLLAAQLDVGSTELPVWNLESGQVKRLRLKHREGLRSATISEDGEWIVTTSFDAFASLWEVDSGRELARFTGQFIGFASAAISPDKTRIALTSNGTGELSVWDPANEQQLVSFPDQETDSIVCAWDPSSDNIVTLVTDVGSKLHFWHAPSWAEIEGAQNGRAVQAAAWKVAPDKWLRKAAESGSAESLNDLAWLLATCDDPKVRNGADAVKFAEQAVAKTDRKNPMILDTLAAAYAEAGQFDQAVNAQKEAIALLQNEEQKKDFATRLKLYESSTPYREH